MSHDLYFWPYGATKNPRQLADRLADEKARLVPDRRVLTFRAELLRRWPELADMIAPWHHDLGRRQPWGRTDLADRFIVLTLPYDWEAISALPALAGGYGLDSYDPQSEQLVSAGSLVQHTPPGDDVAQVEGWVTEEHDHQSGAGCPDRNAARRAAVVGREHRLVHLRRRSVIQAHGLHARLTGHILAG